MRRMSCFLTLLVTAGLSCTGHVDLTPQTNGNVTPSKPDTPVTPAEPLPEGWLKADGKDEGTYGLIKSSGYNYETPDESGAHASAPFRHITQTYDEELDCFVFDFILHIENDDDRGKTNIKDRQRNEIKTDSNSPESMVARKGESLVVKWKFKLPEGMKTTTKFSHIHQLKGIDNSAGTADVSQPLVTFTVRSMSNGTQQFQIIFCAPHSTASDYLWRSDLSEFLGQWVDVEETVKFDTEGSYAVKVTRCSDGKVLAEVEGVKRELWRDGTTGIRPKWGLYRSFGDGRSLASQLRDETLQFADFYVGKK